MKIDKLINNIEYEKIINQKQLEIKNLFSDSRLKKENGLFFAVNGKNTDGYRWLW